MYSGTKIVISYDRAHELLSYDKDTGIVRRKTQVRQYAPGSIVGSLRTTNAGHKSLFVAIDRKQLGLHRVIWLMQTGEMPNIIDHINGDATDNRWENLRNTTQKMNCRNRALRSSNKTGISGVWLVRKSSWVAQIHSDNEPCIIYQGKDFFEACCRRKSAEHRLGYHPNHGMR